jgi:hypothetical protein
MGRIDFAWRDCGACDCGGVDSWAVDCGGWEMNIEHRHDDKDPRKVAAFVVAFVVVLAIWVMW